MNGIKEFHYL